jgi:alkaline phosphatase D/5'-nucleotidase
MSYATRLLSVLVGTALIGMCAGTAAALDILLTNDDGFDSPGITALHTALVGAGHNVTVVAPADQQSGKGGSINTEVFDFTPGVGLMLLVNRGGGVWSLAGTPVDSVKAGLDIVLAGNPPDLIVSGLNFGQNIGKPGSNASGTEGAALAATFRGIPSIAGSVELLLQESPDFLSTVAAFAPASDFIASTIDALVAKNGSDVLPNHMRMLNINFPVPYASIQGVKITKLADGGGLELPLFDPSQGFPDFGIPPLPFPSCADADMAGESCFAAVGIGFSPTPDAVKKSDHDALSSDFITITPMDSDMTGPKTDLEGTLGKLEP